MGPPYTPHLVLLTALLVPFAARADAPGDGSPPKPASAPEATRLTLEDALKLALSHNPDSRSADYDVEAARGALVQASLLPNPNLGIASQGHGLSPFQGPVPNNVELEWPIPIGGKRGAGIDAAKAGLAGAKAGRLATRRQLMLSVETAFVTVLLDRAQLAFAKEERTQFRQTLALNELRYKDGKIAFGELLKLRIQALAEDQTVREAAEALVAARAELRQVVGEHVLAKGFVVVGDLSSPPAPKAVDATTLARTALAQRPDYLALEDAERSASANLDLARRQPIPDLDVTLDYYTDPSGKLGTYDVGLSVPLPIFDRNQGGVTQADAAYAKSHLDTERLRLQIIANAKKAVEEWRTSRAQLADYEGQLLADAKQSLEISRRAYQLGSGSLLDYLDAETSYRQVEVAYRAALARMMLAAANLRFIAGEDLR